MASNNDTQIRRICWTEKERQTVYAVMIGILDKMPAETIADNLVVRLKNGNVVLSDTAFLRDVFMKAQTGIIAAYIKRTRLSSVELERTLPKLFQTANFAADAFSKVVVPSNVVVPPIPVSDTPKQTSSLNDVVAELVEIKKLVQKLVDANYSSLSAIAVESDNDKSVIHELQIPPDANYETVVFYADQALNYLKFNNPKTTSFWISESTDIKTQVFTFFLTNKSIKTVIIPLQYMKSKMVEEIKNIAATNGIKVQLHLGSKTRIQEL